jgi:glycosyltransferase involved in cell wall biosynthesis
VIVGLGKGLRFNDTDEYRRIYPDVPAVDVDGTRGTRQGRCESLWRTIRGQEPDVVLLARPFDGYDVLARLKQRYSRPRLAVTIQVYEPHYFYDLRLYREHVDLCVTSGELIRRAVVAWSGLPEDRVVSVPGGVRPPRVGVVPRRFEGRLRLGYVGRIEDRQKRIFDLADAISLLEKRQVPYGLDIIGTGPDEGELRQRLARFVETGRVVFHGWQDHDALYERFLPRLDCLLHFAVTEGVTIAPREAMAHGVVPVISEFTGLKTEAHFVHEVNALTFPVGDVGEAVRCVERLVAEPELLGRLSRRAMASQTGLYSFEGTIESWANALNDCMSRPIRTGPLPRLAFAPDGRLARLGVSSELAQRLRNIVGRRHEHVDPGSEWPVSSGLMTEEAAEDIRQFAARVERE